MTTHAPPKRSFINRVAAVAALGLSAPLLLVVPVSAESPPLQCAGEDVTILGTPGDDLLIGTDGPDVIRGLEGNDLIFGLDGEDIICGGYGDDEIYGGDGYDHLYGAQGNDLLVAATLPEDFGGRLFGGAGEDHLIGSERWDRMQGGPGNDFMVGLGGRDWMRGGPGRDHLDGGVNIDDVNGRDGGDTLIIDGADIARGGAGVDGCVLRVDMPETDLAELFSCESTQDLAGPRETRSDFPGMSAEDQAEFIANGGI